MILPKTISENVKIALYEDLAGQKDLTALLVPEWQLANAKVISRQEAVICGQAWFNDVFYQLNPAIKIIWYRKDGDHLKRDDVLCELSGPARGILTGERTALNFLQTLSATATVTNQYVQCLAGTTVKLLDTRKTIPGLRAAQKYAVQCGGGTNHRLGLYDAFLIKENHIRAHGSITKIIQEARRIAPGKKIEIEVENLMQLTEAIVVKADIVMLDNFSLDQINEAVKLNQKQVKLEISGNITLSKLREIAAMGVDYISVGAITKNIQAIDFSMQFKQLALTI